MKLKKQMHKRMMKLFKATEEGNHDAMMEGIELLIDTKGETSFDDGYKSCMSDMAVRAYRLANYIGDQAAIRGKRGKDSNEETLFYFNDSDTLAQVIEEYFNNALNNNK
jgi:hypothetical protein